MKEKILKKLNEFKHPSGLFSASVAKTGYDKAWLRDNLYIALSLEEIELDTSIQIYHTIFDILIKHEYKIDWAIKEKPQHAYQYIHGRYNPITLEEYHEEWGNKQNDVIGLFLFLIGRMERKGIKTIRNIHDLIILQKLVDYLESIEYWHDKDNGMWEEYEEIHASSVGACLAGLKEVKSIGVNVPKKLLKNGLETLELLLPNESETKDVDLALLSLIYPFNIVNVYMKNKILFNIETVLHKERGIIRYKGDKYYNNGKEAEWPLGFVWLTKIYEMGNRYEELNIHLDSLKDLIPAEAYFGKTDIPNPNNPLAWCLSMLISLFNYN